MIQKSTKSGYIISKESYNLIEQIIKINTASDFNFKKENKAIIGKFKKSDIKVLQKLEIYKLEENKFIKNKP